MAERVVPSRLESLQKTIKDQVPTVLIRVEKDLERFARLGKAVKTAGQSKLVFLYGESGSGKSTLGFSLPIFLPDIFVGHYSVPSVFEVPSEDIPGHIARSVPPKKGITVISVEGREIPNIDKAAFKSVLMQLNAFLRTRPDLLLVWPVIDKGFAGGAVEILRQVGGQSAFGGDPIIDLYGIQPGQFTLVLRKILNVAGWDLPEAGVTWDEVENIAPHASVIGSFLDSVQSLVVQRTDLESLGLELPTLVFAVSSHLELQEVSRHFRRANKYNMEPTRLLMETPESNVAQWWNARAGTTSSLEFVIAAFEAQLVTLSPSAVVHSILLHGTDSLRAQVAGVRPNRGNAATAMRSTEFYRLVEGKGDFRRWGGQQPNAKTLAAYDQIQGLSIKEHKNINVALMNMLRAAGAKVSTPEFEKQIRTGGLTPDVTCEVNGRLTTIEFHHKSKKECTRNKVANYILSKLKEYAIDFGLAFP